MSQDCMRAAVARGFDRPLEFDDRVVRLPHGFEALVRVEYTGVCHTDLHAIGGQWPVAPKLPFVPGHEGVGRVVATGHLATSLKVGDRVGNSWLWSACGECEYCISGRETLCPQQRNAGYSVDGSFQDYMIVDSRYAAKIPEGLDPAHAAPILCAGVTAYKGLKTTEARPGQWVVVSGIGGLGHLAVQYAVAMGLNVVAVDIVESKLVLARELGAEVVVNAAKTDAAAEVQRRIGGAHGVLVTAPSEAAVAQALGMARRGGTVSIVGLPSGSVPVSVFDTVLNGLTVRGSIVGTREDRAEALDFAARGKVHAIVKRHPFAEVNQVLDELREGRVLGRLVLELAGTMAREDAGYRPTAEFVHA